MQQDNLIFRKAKREDVLEIVRLLSEDVLGKNRESYTETLPEAYYQAFEEINADSNNELMVCERDGEVIGTLQLTFIPGLTHQGAKRAQIEGVRVNKQHRSQGIGQQLFEWAIERAKQKQCRIVQLTTNKSRQDAHRFYERLGFVASHEGLKLEIP